MNLIELLQEKLTPGIIEKIAAFLGESHENTEKAMDVAIPTMLGGLVQQGTTYSGAEKIMDIVKEGGHTGEILDDLPKMLDNFDKTQLYSTIGSNIFNHFFGNTTNVLTEKVANISNIRKVSATKVLGMVAPMVLGALGYVVNKENLGISGLKDLLEEQREPVAKALPSTIAAHLPLRPISAVSEESPIVAESPQTTTTVEAEKTKAEHKNDSFFDKVLPWLLLVVLALASAYYVRSCRLKKEENASSGVLTDYSDSTYYKKRNGTADSSTITLDSNTVNKGEKPETGIAETESNVNTTPAETTPTATTESPKTETTNSSGDRRSESRREESTSDDSFSMSNLRNGQWTTFAANNFKRNSAEISNRSAVKQIASYLNQHPGYTIAIAPQGRGRLAEDRAYAIREQLYQNGIDTSRVDIESSRGGNDDGVSIRIRR